jgi:hypothetical protein
MVAVEERTTAESGCTSGRQLAVRVYGPGRVQRRLEHVGPDQGPSVGHPVTATGTLTMNETGVSQNACQGATLTLNLTSN